MIEEFINSFGKDGWELIASSPDNASDYNIRLFFKRVLNN
jgi:hypothetical protein